MTNPNMEGNDQWQENCSTINESISHFFLNEDGADIWFVPLLNAAEPPRTFPAHKFILKSRSSVFNAQFRFDQMNASKESGEGPSACKKPKKDPPSNDLQWKIELPDVEPEAFQEFLRFCYTDKAEITSENATSILYIANRYNVKPLMKLAIKFICENTKLENVFEILAFAIQFDFEGIKEIKGHALEIICSKTEEAVKTEAFLGISPETLELFVSQDKLAISQVALFNEIIRWAKKRQMIAGNEGKLLRELLGIALFRIQYWEMSIWDFRRFVVPEKVLTDAETLYVYNKLSSDESETFFSDPECPFPRFGIHRNIRVLRLDIHNVTKFADKPENLIWSEPVSINGLSFRLKAVKKLASSKLGFFLRCNGDGTKNWSCIVNTELILVSKKPGKQNKKRKLKQHQYGLPGATRSRGYSQFIDFAVLLDPKNFWVENDTVTLKALVNVIEQSRK